MAGSKVRFTFRLRVLLMLLGTCWVLAGAFAAFQYHREKEYKTAMMDERLQMHNLRILDDMRRGEPIADIVARITPPTENLRVTLIDSAGAVLYDSRIPSLRSNHNGRQEVRQARLKGKGVAIERLSEGDATNYFYSALRGDDGTVVRSAAPYTHSLTEFLAVDSAILWIMGALTLLSTLLGLMATRRISVSIRRLSDFAERGGRGERIYSGDAFPHDELGNIAANIVRMYVQREEQHRRAIASEQDKARLKKQLTNNINHELKTPVASILVSLDLLRDHPDIAPEKREEILRRVRANVERLSALLKDVSTITRMEDAAAMIERKPVNLTALVNELAAEARLGTDMEIAVDMPPELVVSGDRVLLESVFRNLIDNAIAHSGASRLSITADVAGRFRVRDNGCGVAAEHLPRLFERFYRVDSGRTRPSGGTGLGLSIVRNAVAVHGGSISVSSPSGLLFEFTLPAEFNKNATIV